MNTPEPCCRCTHVAFDCTREDDPLDEAYCQLKMSKPKLNTKWGDKNCPYFVKYSQYDDIQDWEKQSRQAELDKLGPEVPYGESLHDLAE